MGSVVMESSDSSLSLTGLRITVASALTVDSAVNVACHSCSRGLCSVIFTLLCLRFGVVVHHQNQSTLKPVCTKLGVLLSPYHVVVPMASEYSIQEM